VILNVDCTEHLLLAIEVLSAEVEACNMIISPHPLRQLIFCEPRDKLQPWSFVLKREEPGNEFGLSRVQLKRTVMVEKNC
jgi:hypothetical protein